MIKVRLNKKISSRIQNGHPWIFANEIQTVDGTVNGGEIVDVFAADNSFVGKGYINPKSQIMVRLLTRKKSDQVDKNFFLQKIKRAWEYRQKLGYVENCRLIFGEADDLPQLIIDKFNDFFVIQTLALGIDIWKESIVEALNEIFRPRGIFERNDVPVRELEGLSQQKGFLSEPFDTNIIINENGLKFHVDIANGQKTGYFLDQQDNRKAIQHIVKGADVLGAFCYTGTFEIHAAHYGAKQVLGLDISENACEQAPKSRENIQKAIVGYKEINLRGMKLLKPGGFLVTSSCTNLIPPELFLEIIEMAAKDARKKLRQVVFQTQSADHPILRGLENTQYLKFLIVEVV